MTEKDNMMRSIGGAALDFLAKGQRAGLKAADIAEGIRAGMKSDYLDLSDALERGRDVVDPMKYARAADGKDEKYQNLQPLERNIAKAIDKARQRNEEKRASKEYREMVVKQKRAEIHKALDARGVNSFHGRVNGYNLDLIRDPKRMGPDGKPQLKMYINNCEINDKWFDKALAEVAGVNNSRAFNAGAEVGKNLKDQAAIQGARTITQTGINVATAPARAVPQALRATDAMTSQMLSKFLSTILAVSRASHAR